MLFCPTCGNILLFEVMPKASFQCKTCPYIQLLKSVAAREVPLVPKSVEDIFGGKDVWKRMPSVPTPCQSSSEPACDGDMAYTWQIQTRSSDEAATNYYKCTICGFQWND